MRRHVSMLAALVLITAMAVSSALAGNADPLFINVTSDDAHRSMMAIGFGQSQLERGHPLTVYLSDKGVLVADRKNAAQFAQQQKALAEIAEKGGVVLVCPVCSKKFGVTEADLAQGARLTNPDITGAALFKDNTRTLSW